MNDWQVEFQWDADNLDHAARHDVTPALVLEVAGNDPLLYPNSEDGRAGNVLMIGPNTAGQFWSIALLELGPEHFRPITGWRSTSSEIVLYRTEITE